MKLHVREWGWTDRVAVLVHGFNCDSEDWWRLAPELVRRRYRVLAPDLRGHGLSPRADSYEIEAFAADLIESLPVRPDVMIGHSLGGLLLGMTAETIRPGRAIFLDPPWAPFDVVNADLFPPLEQIQTWSDEELWKYLREMFPTWSAADVDADVASWRRWDPRSAAVVDQLHDGWPLRVPDRVVPSLVIAADPSMICPPAAQDEARKDGYEVRVATGLTHAMHRDDFDAVVNLLEGWI